MSRCARAGQPARPARAPRGKFLFYRPHPENPSRRAHTTQPHHTRHPQPHPTPPPTPAARAPASGGHPPGGGQEEGEAGTSAKPHHAHHRHPHRHRPPPPPPAPATTTSTNTHTTSSRPHHHATGTQHGQGMGSAGREGKPGATGVGRGGGPGRREARRPWPAAPQPRGRGGIPARQTPPPPLPRAIPRPGTRVTATHRAEAPRCQPERRSRCTAANSMPRGPLAVSHPFTSHRFPRGYPRGTKNRGSGGLTGQTATWHPAARRRGTGRATAAAKPPGGDGWPGETRRPAIPPPIARQPAVTW